MALDNVMAVRNGKVIGPPRADGSMTWKTNNLLGAKNINKEPFTCGKIGSANGVSWVVNDDGSITVNGTASASTDILFHSRDINRAFSLFLPNGKYIISGVAEGCCNPDASSNKTFSLCMTCTKNGTSTRLGYDMGDGAICTVNGDDHGTDGAYVGFFITVWQGYTMDNVTFYPMIRVAEDPDPTYQPPAKTNRDLSEVKTITGTGSTAGTAYTAKKVGNVVTVWFRTTANIAANQDVNFGQLPAEFRPPLNVVGTIHNGAGSINYSTMSICRVATSGNLLAYTYSAFNSGAVLATVTYIVD